MVIKDQRAYRQQLSRDIYIRKGTINSSAIYQIRWVRNIIFNRSVNIFHFFLIAFYCLLALWQCAIIALISSNNWELLLWISIYYYYYWCWNNFGSINVMPWRHDIYQWWRTNISRSIISMRTNIHRFSGSLNIIIAP